jgi:hypothetical protein
LIASLLAKAIEVTGNNLKVLHPFYAVLTEDLANIGEIERSLNRFCLARVKSSFNANLISVSKALLEVISGIRTIP